MSDEPMSPRIGVKLMLTGWLLLAPPSRQTLASVYDLARRLWPEASVDLVDCATCESESQGPQRYTYVRTYTRGR
ncbi:hypothetical protein JCM18909A_08680 [Cutibacterium acnes subsp. elongatum]